MPSKTWADGDNLPASDLNTYLRDQVITICTSGTRPTTSTDGRPIYETDTDRFYIWDTTASAWQNWTWLGAWTSWTPSFTQSGTPTLTNHDSKYTRTGRTINANATVEFTSAGSAGTAISCTLPVTATFTRAKAVGSFYFSATGALYAGTVLLVSSTSAQFVCDYSSNLLGANPSIAIASGNNFTFSMTYEAAAG